MPEYLLSDISTLIQGQKWRQILRADLRAMTDIACRREAVGTCRLLQPC
eukprot:COSAG01_NODE_54245_length_333_cov_1.098291_1_plen_48_part_01